MAPANEHPFPKALSMNATVEDEICEGKSGEFIIHRETLKYEDIRELRKGTVGLIGDRVVNAAFANLCGDPCRHFGYVNSHSFSATMVWYGVRYGMVLVSYYLGL